MMALTGTKAWAKAQLKARGIKTVKNETGQEFKLSQATTRELLKHVTRLA